MVFPVSSAAAPFYFGGLTDALRFVLARAAAQRVLTHSDAIRGVVLDGTLRPRRLFGSGFAKILLIFLASFSGFVDCVHGV